jgi:Disulphide bond corrector protein DsbC
MSPPRIGIAMMAVSAFVGGGVSWTQAQSLAPSVQWSASAQVDGTDPQGRRALLEVAAIVPQGWHVYALNEPEGGPTPLRVAIEQGVTVKITGPASGAIPEKRHDPSFDLDTEFYPRDFTLRFPLESLGAVRALQSLPVSVRFQLCSERECQPPKTIHLIASLNGAAST